jgi:hypothetical protein
MNFPVGHTANEQLHPRLGLLEQPVAEREIKKLPAIYGMLNLTLTPMFAMAHNRSLSSSA